MALKQVVDKLDEVDEGFRGLYVKDDATGQYRLDVETDEAARKELEELRKERERMAKHNETLLAEKKKEAERARLAEEERARRERDVESLERSLKTKHETDLQQYQQRTNMLQSALEQQMVDNLAIQLANELSDSPALMVPHIKSRLRASEVDGRWKTTVVDVMGNVTATTPAELVEQMRGDKQFAPLVRGTKAAGGGANGANSIAGGNGNGHESTTTTYGNDDRLARARAHVQTKTWGQN